MQILQANFFEFVRHRSDVTFNIVVWRPGLFTAMKDTTDVVGPHKPVVDSVASYILNQVVNEYEITGVLVRPGV